MSYSSFLIPRFSKYCAVVLLVVVSLGMMSFAVSAQTPPTPPSRFAGSVSINGQAAPTGTAVIALIGGVICGSGAVNAAGTYVLDVDAIDSCGSSGLIVVFEINGVKAAESGTWKNDQLTILNLSVDTSVPEVVVPAPPNTGSGLDLELTTASSFNSAAVLFLLIGSLFVLSISYRIRTRNQEK